MEWISVKDRLPDAKSMVFVWVDEVSQPVKHWYTESGRFISLETDILTRVYYECEYYFIASPPKQ